MTGRSRAVFIIGQAIIWAAVIFGCGLALDGDAFSDIILILGGGAAVFSRNPPGRTSPLIT